jgi:hypothetical protein
VVWGKRVSGVVLALAALGCGDDESEAANAGGMAGNSGSADPNLGIGDPDPQTGYLPTADVDPCEARVTELTVELSGETYQLRQQSGLLLGCCGSFSLTLEGCQTDGDRCYTVLIEQEKLTLTQGTRGDGGITWGESVESRATNEPEITEWPATRCSIDGRPFYYWIDMVSHSAISVPLSAKVKAYVTGSADCQCQ